MKIVAVADDNWLDRMLEHGGHFVRRKQVRGIGILVYTVCVWLELAQCHWLYAFVTCCLDRSIVSCKWARSNTARFTIIYVLPCLYSMSAIYH